jgi:hypothetical protein
VALCACLAAGAGASAASAAPGRILTQRDGEARNTITLSAQGARALHVFAADEPQAVEVIVRYRDRRAFVVDHARRAYASMPLADLLARFRTAREASARTGGPTDLRARVLFPPAPRIATLAQPLALRGVRARGVEVRGGDAPQRLWFADGGPSVPASLSTQLAGIGRRSTPLDRALRTRLDSTLLRVEVQQGGRFVPVLETTSVVDRDVPESAFAPPRGFRAIAAAQLFEDQGTARAAAPPANVVKIIPTNPVSSRRRIYNLYWGTTFGGTSGEAFRTFMNDATRESLRTTYSRGLRQYGIRGSAALKRSRHVNSEPPRDIGGANVVAPQLMIQGQQAAGRVPRYWVCCGAKDPIVAVFVNGDRIAPAAWGGYHFWVVTEAVAVPWPLSLAVHAGVPYELNRVPNAAISGSGAARTTGRQSATGVMSHEYVEAATDPFPFFGWIDPAKTPLWTESEVADICAANTAVNGFTFAQYWSETDDRCIP